jgi:hypothetical protein
VGENAPIWLSSLQTTFETVAPGIGFPVAFKTGVRITGIVSCKSISAVGVVVDMVFENKGTVLAGI